jgi:hypothetical protein
VRLEGQAEVGVDLVEAAGAEEGQQVRAQPPQVVGSRVRCDRRLAEDAVGLRLQPNLLVVATQEERPQLVGILVIGDPLLFDHNAPAFQPQLLPDPAFQSGGEGAKWERVGTIPTGNPHTDLDFFTSKGDVYASVGTLAIGPNAGGQTIVQLTQNGNVEPRVAALHPSAACQSNPSAALGLQHDVEAAPKGNLILNSFNPFADRRDAQVIIDATDAGGRCHDQAPSSACPARRRAAWRSST